MDIQRLERLEAADFQLIKSLAKRIKKVYHHLSKVDEEIKEEMAEMVNDLHIINEMMAASANREAEYRKQQR